MAPQFPSNVPDIIFGGGLIGEGNIPDLDALKKWLDVFKSYGGKHIDTAAMYPNSSPGKSEELLGEAGAASCATIDTKNPGFGPAPHSKDVVTPNIARAAKALGLEGGNAGSIDVYYLHMPNFATSFEETLEAVTEAHKAGLIRRFGLSNFAPRHVEEFVELAEKHGKVTVVTRGRQ